MPIFKPGTPMGQRNRLIKDCINGNRSPAPTNEQVKRNRRLAANPNAVYENFPSRKSYA